MNRSLLGSWLTNTALALRSAEEERLFVRLMLVADAHGRFEVNLRTLLVATFPLSETITTEEFERWFGGLTEPRGALDDLPPIRLYMVNGHTYGYFTAWGPVPKSTARSRFPNPEDSSGFVLTPPSTSKPKREAWCSAHRLIVFYNTHKPAPWRKIATINDDRLKVVGAALKRYPAEAFWRSVIITEPLLSRFLMMETPPVAGHEHFTPNLEWLCQRGRDRIDNALKVFEGKYRDGRRPDGTYEKSLKDRPHADSATTARGAQRYIPGG